MKFTCDKKDVAIKDINDSEVEVEMLDKEKVLTTLMDDELVQAFLSDDATVRFLYHKYSDTMISALDKEHKEYLIKRLQESISK